MASTTNIDRIKALRTFASSLRGEAARRKEEYADRRRYDKQAFGFTHRIDTSWNVFKAPALGFEAYVGTYGNSSAGRDWSVDQTLIDAFFLKALNKNKQVIFDSMAEMAEIEAEELRDKASAELETLRALLAEAV